MTRAEGRCRWIAPVIAALGAIAAFAATPPALPVELGKRPLALVADMDTGPRANALKTTLEQCRGGPFQRSRFSIGHRGAPWRYAEHTRESYLAAARQGAGRIECDATATRDGQLVCRHDACDLHSTTNILETPLAARCREPFVAADRVAGTPAHARCCADDLTLAEFRTLCGRRDVVDPGAGDVTAYLTPQGDEPAGGSCGTLMSHAESIALFRELGVDMIPELKAPADGYPDAEARRASARRLIDEYRSAGIDPSLVWPQSFDLAVIGDWIDGAPEFGRQAVFLDGRLDIGAGSPDAPQSLDPGFDALVRRGVRIVAPPMWVLVTLDPDGAIVPSAYARAARGAGLSIVTWTLERSGPLHDGGGPYYRSVRAAIDNDGDTYTMLDALARQVGVSGVFSDWPATVTYYANCMDLK